jgi:hypothetical protein
MERLMIQEKLDRYLPYLSLIGLFGYFLFDGFFIRPIFKYSFVTLSLFFLLADPAFRIISKNFKIHLNRLFATGLGLISILSYFLREWIDLPAVAGISQEAGIIPQLREFLLAITVLTSISFLVYTIILEIGRISLEAQSQLSDKKKSLLQDTIMGFMFLLPILVGINYIAVMRNYNFDLSAKGKFSLSLISKSIIKNLDKDIEIIGFYPRPLEADGPGSSLSLSRIRPDLEIFLDQYQASSPRIKSKFVNADVELDKLSDFGQMSNGNILVRSKREIQTNNSSLYNEEKISIKELSDLEDLERKLTSAIINVSTPKRKVYFTSANGERYGAAFSNLNNERISQFTNSINYLNFQINELGYAEGWPKEIPDDADLVAIIGPTTKLNEIAQQAILKYVLEKNGKLFISSEPQGTEDFSWLLQKAGIKFQSKMLTQQADKPHFILAKKVMAHPITELISKKEIGVVYPFSGSLETFSDSINPFKFTSQFFLESGEDSYVDANGSGKQMPNTTKGNFKLAVALQTIPKISDKSSDLLNQPINEGRLVFFTGTSWITDQFISYNLNRNLALASISWMFQEKIINEIPKKTDDVKTINLNDNQKIMVWFIGIFLYPGIIIGAGSYYVISRRKKEEDE